MLNITLRLFAYNSVSASHRNDDSIKRKTDVSFCSLRLGSAEVRLQPEMSRDNTQFGARHIPRVCFMAPVDALPSNRSSGQ